MKHSDVKEDMPPKTLEKALVNHREQRNTLRPDDESSGYANRKGMVNSRSGLESYPRPLEQASPREQNVVSQGSSSNSSHGGRSEPNQGV